MSRVPRRPQTSLDLFLDTISNTFGGIVFLAILLSLLVQMRTKTDQVPAESADELSAEQYQEIRLEFEELAAKRDILSSTVLALQKKRTPTKNVEVTRLAEALEQVQPELQAALQRQAVVSQAVARQMEENARIVQDLETLQQQLQETTAALQQEESAMEKAVEEMSQVYKPPKVRNTTKKSVMLILTAERLHPVYEAGSLSKFSPHVRAARVPQGTTVSAISGMGWDLTSKSGREQAENFLRLHRPNEYFANIAVWPDSFGAFADLKAQLLKSNHEYQLIPIATDGPILITASQELPRVQ